MKRETKKIMLGALKTLVLRVALAPFFPFVAAGIVVGAICLIIGLLMAEPVLPQA